MYADEALKTIGDSKFPNAAPSIALCAAYTVKLLGEGVELLIPDLSGLWQSHLPKVECAAFLDALLKVDIPESIKQNINRQIAVTYSFPEFIVNEWVERFGLEETRQLCASLNQQAPITIRVNTLKTTVEQCQNDLLKHGVNSERTKLSPFGLVLAKRINSQELDAFKKGYFEMQDEGSQLLSLLLEPSAGECVVDACAGAGGKSLHIAAMMQNEGSLLAIDVDKKRLQNLRQRVQRAGISIVKPSLELHKGDATEWDQKADKVLVDAPCSGVGIFRRSPAAKLTFNEASVESFSRTQYSLLEKYKDLAKPGGRLVYATCTLIQKENEDVVHRFLGTHTEFTLLSASEILAKQGIHIKSNASQFLTLLPHKTTTDGFFAAVMVKKEEKAR